MTNEELQLELEKIRKENIELQNKLVDTVPTTPVKYIDPIHDNPEWLEFVKTMKEKRSRGR